MRPALMALLAPLGLVGVALNWLPYRLPGWLAGWLTTTPDEPASYMLMAGLMGFPSFWAAETAAAWHFWGPPAAIATLPTAPPTRYVALLLSESRDDMRGERRPRGPGAQAPPGA